MRRHIHAGAEVAQQLPVPQPLIQILHFNPWVVSKSVLAGIAWSSLCRRRKQGCEMLLGEWVARGQASQFCSVAGQAGMRGLGRCFKDHLIFNDLLGGDLVTCRGVRAARQGCGDAALSLSSLQGMGTRNALLEICTPRGC